ncbi:MAG: TonB-dependent siderophore receptor, partial [Nostoc sp.]
TYLSTGYDLEHRFSENWKLRSAFRYLNYDSNTGVVAAPFAFNEATGNFTRYFTFTQSDNKSYSLQNNVTGKFATGSVKHTLLFGADLNRTELNTYLFTDLSTPLLLNIFNPVYGQIPPRPPR